MPSSCGKPLGNPACRLSSGLAAPCPRSRLRARCPAELRWTRLTSPLRCAGSARPPAACHWPIGLAPRFFDLGRGELVFFRRFPVFFEQNPTLNRKKSFRCAKGRAFSFFSGRKKFFLSPKRASPTSSLYSPGASRAEPRQRAESKEQSASSSRSRSDDTVDNFLCSAAAQRSRAASR